MIVSSECSIELLGRTAGSFDLGAGDLHDVGPSVPLAPEVSAELRRGAARNLHAQTGIAFPQFGQRAVQGDVETFDDRCGGLGWRAQAIPSRHLVARNTCLCDRWNFRRERRSLWPSDGEGFQPSGSGVGYDD